MLEICWRFLVYFRGAKYTHDRDRRCPELQIYYIPFNWPERHVGITLAYYLIGKPLMSLLEGNVSSVPTNRLSTCPTYYKGETRFLDSMASRISKQASKTLQMDQRRITTPGWNCRTHKEQKPCSQWVLGKIIKLLPGKDGIARIVIIKTATGRLKRTTKLLSFTNRLTIEKQKM